MFGFDQGNFGNVQAGTEFSSLLRCVKPLKAGLRDLSQGVVRRQAPAIAFASCLQLFWLAI